MADRERERRDIDTGNREERFTSIIKGEREKKKREREGERERENNRFS